MAHDVFAPDALQTLENYIRSRSGPYADGDAFQAITQCVIHGLSPLAAANLSTETLSRLHHGLRVLISVLSAIEARGRMQPGMQSPSELAAAAATLIPGQAAPPAAQDRAPEVPPPCEPEPGSCSKLVDMAAELLLSQPGITVLDSVLDSKLANLLEPWLVLLHETAKACARLPQPPAAAPDLLFMLTRLKVRTSMKIPGTYVPIAVSLCCCQI